MTRQRLTLARERLDALKRQIQRRIVGHHDLVDGILACLLSSGHVLLEGVPGLGKTLLVKTLERCAAPGVRPHPVHPRPHAGGHHRHAGGLAGRRGPPALPVPARPGVHAAPARRRDQPRDAEDPIGAAGGDGGEARHRRAHRACAAGAVHGARDPEPHRDGGHLSAARGPARSLPAQVECHLSRRRSSCLRSSIAPPARPCRPWSRC